MLSVLINNYCRIFKRLPLMLIMIAVTLVSIVFAVYITGTQQVKGHIVFVSKTSVTSVNSKYLSVVTMKTEPPYSDLVKQRYDAYVIDRGSGNFEIKTLRSNDFKNMVMAVLKNPGVKIPPQKTDRGVGVNIIGFMMMFLLMSTFMNLFTFADDKEQKQLERIAISPIRFPGYLAAHFIYCLSMFLPQYLMVVILKLSGFNIGFSLLQYALMFAVIGFLGISTAMLLHTLIKKPDNANMLGNSIIVLTSVLAGSFYSFSKNNAVLDNIVKVLPQKQIMDFALHLQNGDSLSHLAPLIYAVAFSLVLFSASCAILAKKYVKRV